MIYTELQHRWRSLPDFLNAGWVKKLHGSVTTPSPCCLPHLENVRAWDAHHTSNDINLPGVGVSLLSSAQDHWTICIVSLQDLKHPVEAVCNRETLASDVGHELVPQEERYSLTIRKVLKSRALIKR